MPDVMRAARITQYGGPEVLEIVEVPIPEIAAHEMRVKVLATSVCTFDVLFRLGLLDGAR